MRRRIFTVPLVGSSCVLILLLWPLLAPLSGFVGLFRGRHFALLRTLTLAGGYAVMELWGLAMLFGVWLSTGFGMASGALERRAFWVQRLWLRGLWWAARACFTLKVRLEGTADEAETLLVLARHTSMLDVLIPGNYVLGPTRQLRWVLKKELLLEPCLDIAGHWMPNHFVDRSGAHSGNELASLEALARGMKPRQGVIIFPEGTRFSEGRRAWILARLQETDPAMAARAAGLENLLPPRAGGTRALLTGASRAEVLFVAHHGLEGSRSWAQLISGELVGRTLSVRLYSSERPYGAEADVASWLCEHWAHMDAWISARAAD